MHLIIMGQCCTMAVQKALKFRAIRSWGGCSANEVLWLNKVFDNNRNEEAIKWIKEQADGYDNRLKVVSDSIMQESIKSK